VSQLFTPFRLRGLEFKNRIFVSPMCQYSAEEGVPNNWHLVHLGSRAVGGAALVIAEATAVSAVGRITFADAGIWNEEQEKSFFNITNFIKQQNCIAGIQLAHAGRKASTNVPWSDKKVLSGEKAWPVLAPSEVVFSEEYPQPSAMNEEQIQIVVNQFKAAAERSLRAGFQVVEVHMAHGYLLHEFLSPLSNKRTDAFGGSLENRMRFPLQVVSAVRQAWPSDLPVFVRISATDWVEGGWSLPDSIILAERLQELGVDFIDCSTGGNVATATIPVGPGYQVQFAEAIKAKVPIAVGAVGIIVEAHQAEEIIAAGKADAVLLARELLRDPYWPLHAAKALNFDLEWPKPYLRAKR
jgi:2,4-dienoyl-CoA reductase-like NADH-dependent reductase (Old Yellow Enzyme family)